MPKYANTSTYRRWKRARSKVMARPVRRGITKRYGRPKKRLNIPALVNKVLKSKIETKQSTTTITDGQEILHNNFLTLETPLTMFELNNGTTDPMNSVGTRVGDEVTLKGISMKMMVELNERFSDVTFRFMVIKSAKGDGPTRANLFRGQSGNKMIDGINTERYTIVAQKIFKMKAPNAGTAGAANTFVDPPGNYGFNSWDPKLSRATKILRVYIPGTKFARNGVLKYENGSATQLKFFDYTCVLYAYSNYTTSQDLVNIARVNDYIKTTYYTDA